MYARPTVLVIGAGIGGIAAAARLARSGYDVTVLEKNATPGGRCSQLIRDGHRFDTGPTLFLMPEVFAETYRALGERMQDHLDLRRIDPTYRIHFADGTQLALTANFHAMQTQLEAIEPGSFGGLLRYLVEGHQHYHLSLQRFVGGSTHPGTGLPIVLISARLTTERILNEIGVPRSAHSVRSAAVGYCRSNGLAQQSAGSRAKASVSHLPTPDSTELRPAEHLLNDRRGAR